jgi:ribonuclease P protein component
MGNLRFTKAERLSRRSWIQRLFREGKSFTVYPLRVLWMSAPEPVTAHQVMFSVPAGTVGRAVDRNRIKRRLREAYRLSREALPGSPNFLIAYIYLGKPGVPYRELAAKLTSTLARIGKA